MLLRRCRVLQVSPIITSISPSSYVKSVSKSSRHIFLASSSKPISKSHPFCRCLVISASRVANTSVNLDKHEDERLCVSEWNGLKQKVEAIGIDYGVYTPGLYTCLMCPKPTDFTDKDIDQALHSFTRLLGFLYARLKCKGGKSMIRSLSFHVNENSDFAMWRCFIIECGWAGQIVADTRPSKDEANNISELKVDLPRQLTEKNLRLEPPGEEVIAFFADRMISKEVLQRNSVMQTVNDEIAIAFTYRLHGQIVNCKYRNIDKKRFWQVKGSERILYGLDGIRDSDEIIIVEGETDKLSMEEAGIFNSVSVPDGAPNTVSKNLPSMELDTRFKYIWNCKEYLDKASRIILATDADKPGQALAEELARRLGRDRCWRVTWPKKDELGSFKDANDVLKNLGADALRDIIKNAKPYEMQNSV